jgi:hypothetical protein
MTNKEKIKENRAAVRIYDAGVLSFILFYSLLLNYTLYCGYIFGSEAGAMKKFFLTLFILLILGGAAFFFGWAQLSVPPGSVGVIRSKTHGIDPVLVREGEFRWIWYKLIPTNVNITVFRLEERRYSFSVRNSLPSGDVYSAFAGINADFSYEVSASLSWSLKPLSLVFLTEEHGIDSREALQSFEENLSQEIGTFIRGWLGSETLSSAEELERLLGSGRSARLEEDILKAFPHIENLSCLVQSAAFPDFALYRQIRGLYEDYLLKQRTYLGAALDQKAEERIESRFRFDELEKYGELLTKYPILLQYLALEKGLDPVTPP